MPYLHWESEGKRQEMNTAIADIISSKRYDMAGLSRVIEETVKKTYNNRSKPSANPNKSLFAEHLFPEPPQPPLHLRRTLDQFQYYMTDNTEDRDTDQVISRYFKRRHSDTPLPIMMVDQLWIWILDRSTKCLISHVMFIANHCHRNCRDELPPTLGYQKGAASGQQYLGHRQHT